MTQPIANQSCHPGISLPAQTGRYLIEARVIAALLHFISSSGEENRLDCVRFFVNNQAKNGMISPDNTLLSAFYLPVILSVNYELKFCISIIYINFKKNIEFLRQKLELERVRFWGGGLWGQRPGSAL